MIGSFKPSVTSCTYTGSCAPTESAYYPILWVHNTRPYAPQVVDAHKLLQNIYTVYLQKPIIKVHSYNVTMQKHQLIKYQAIHHWLLWFVAL